MSTLENPFSPFDADLSLEFAEITQMALAEDIGEEDLTGLLIPEDRWIKAGLRVRENATLCGAPWFESVMKLVDERIELEWFYAEGDTLRENSLVCRIEGPARAILTAERTAMNFLQLLSGVASATRKFADMIAGTEAGIYDTRKTLPGLRLAQKYAVRVGGGFNQRLALYDGILIKENHIEAAGSIRAALEAAQILNKNVPIQIEVETLEQLDEALKNGAELILLDNFSLADIKTAVEKSKDKAILEVSGGVNLLSVRRFAETGVQRISVGALTKDVKSIDFSLRVFA